MTPEPLGGHAVRRIVVLGLVTALTALVAGCFNPFNPRVSVERVTSSPPPTPNSPANAVRLFAWCWKNRDASRYQEVFTDDYRFLFAPNDSAGNPYRDAPWIREYEMDMARNMFTGGGDQPPASEIQITIDNLLVSMPDPRPGREFKWHKTIRTNVDLKFTVTDENGTPSVTPVTGKALFYLCRGDSAKIPPELTGFRPDSTRWWIERWEDETVLGKAAIALRPRSARRLARPTPGSPIQNDAITLAQLRALYGPIH